MVVGTVVEASPEEATPLAAAVVVVELVVVHVVGDAVERLQQLRSIITDSEPEAMQSSTAMAMRTQS